MQTYIDKGTEPPLPPSGSAGYLVGYLFEAGPAGFGAAGMVPLPWQDISHWQRNTGVVLESWEARALRRLSADYIATTQQAESPSCPAPWLAEEPTPVDRLAVAQQVRSLLRS